MHKRECYTLTLLKIENLTKKVGGRNIVDHVSLELKQGEIMGLLGPNGAGKTTTIRMIVGLIAKTEGNVIISNIDTSTHFEQAMEQVGVIVENPDLYKYLSGYDNLLHFSRMTPSVTHERFNEVVNLVGLENRIHDKVGTYSLGMRQRLGLAVALIHKPKLLILDEPTNGLDAAGIRELRVHLRMLAEQEGIGILISSHLMAEMEMMCDTVAILQKGMLIGVHRISEMLQDEKVIVSYEVDQPTHAVQVLQTIMAGEEIKREQNMIYVQLPKSRIPEVNQKLMQSGINVYSVQNIKRTLEDKFIEMTGGE
jgi:ABC-2 type transport system ATP-binding protein